MGVQENQNVPVAFESFLRFQLFSASANGYGCSRNAAAAANNL